MLRHNGHSNNLPVRNLLFDHREQVSVLLVSPRLLAHARSSITGGSTALSVVFGWNVIIKSVLPHFLDSLLFNIVHQLVLHARCILRITVIYYVSHRSLILRNQGRLVVLSSLTT